MNYKRFYIDGSAVFITIVTNNRNPILTNHVDILKKTLANVSNIYKFELTAYIIMKDHIHCILKPENINDYPKIIKSFKYSFTKNVGIVMPTYNKVWQNRYWAHIILNKEDLYKHLDYIHYNSIKHYNIPPKNWNYSSFITFVKNGLYDYDWCNFDDKNNVKEMNFE